MPRTPQPASRKPLLPIAIGGLLIAVVAYFFWPQSPKPSPSSELSTPQTTLPGPTGKELSERYCGSCHLYTEPDLLPKKSWNFLLTYMGLRLGIDDDSFLGELTEGEKAVLQSRRSSLKDEGLIPSSPAMSAAEWKTLRQYYQDAAPESALPPENKPPIEGIATLFEKREHAYQFKGAINTLVRIDETNHQILIGDSLRQQLTLLDRNIDPIVDYPTKGAFWVDAALTGNGVFLLSVGDIAGSHVGQKLGKVAFGRRVGKAYRTEGFPLTDLYRPSDIELADMDNDGINEMLVCSFGDEGGDFSIFKWDLSKRGFSETPSATLYNDTGPIKCATHDFNGDGLLDIVLIVSDVQEHLSLFLNKGNGAYQEKSLVKAHPSWGYIGLELADVNGDGHMDILTGNGDNVDSDPYNSLKRYHGLRVYLNDEQTNFREAFFYPMNGAYDVHAHDYDQDGDIDIAANAFYPDFAQSPLENFVYLEQTAPMQFTPRRHPATEMGRWISMDTGDIDGDGDIDIALGGAYVPIGMQENFPELLAEMMEKGEPLLILENKTRP